MTLWRFPNSVASLQDTPAGTQDFTLAAPLGAADTSMTVNSVPAGVSAAPFVVRIDQEWIRVGAISGTTWSSLTRGYGGSTAAAHANGAKGYLVLLGQPLEEITGMVLIEDKTLAADASEVTFSNIPQTFTHLDVVAKYTESGTTSTLYAQFNGDTATNYHYHGILVNDALSVSGYGGTNEAQIAVGFGLANQRAVTTFRIYHYAITNDYKLVTIWSSALLNATGTGGGMWLSNSAITSMRLFLLGGTTLISGSRFRLYGIR